MSLTPKQTRFVEEYLIDLNSTQAAIRAGYSKKTANQQGPRLLVNVGIATAIAEKQAARSERTNIDADKVLRELADIGFANMLDYMTVTEDGAAMVVDLSTLTREQAAALKEISLEVSIPKDKKTDPTRRTKIKLADKRAALVDIGKHLGMFKTVIAGDPEAPVKQEMKVKVLRIRPVSPLCRGPVNRDSVHLC